MAPSRFRHRNRRVNRVWCSRRRGAYIDALSAVTWRGAGAMIRSPRARPPWRGEAMGGWSEGRPGSRSGHHGRSGRPFDNGLILVYDPVTGCAPRRGVLSGRHAPGRSPTRRELGSFVSGSGEGAVVSSLFDSLGFGLKIFGPSGKLLPHFIPYGDPVQFPASVSHRSKFSCIHRVLASYPDPPMCMGGAGLLGQSRSAQLAVR